MAVDVGFAGALFVVPLLMGGRTAPGQLALVVVSCWLAAAWAVHQIFQSKTHWKWTGAELLLLGGAGLLMFQITPLPASLVEQLSPHVAETLPTWYPSEAGAPVMGEWHYLSLSISETRAALITFACYAVIFFVAVQRMQTRQDVEGFLKWICLGAGGMAVFAIAQYATSDRKFFWFYDYPFTTAWVVQGSFTNRNHFAHFMALSVGPLIWWLLKCMQQREADSFRAFGQPGAGMQELQIGLLLATAGTVVFAGMVTMSRGGAVAMATAWSVTLLILYRRKFVSGKAVAGLSTVAALSGCFLFVYGFEMVADRLADWETSARQIIWEANGRTLADFPLFGTGAGSHVEAYKMYLDLPFDQKEYTHAESSYVQTASETGLAGLSLALGGVLLCVSWCLRALKHSRARESVTLVAAVTGSLAAHFLHATVDFLWYVPGVMVVVAVLAAAACRLHQLARETAAAAEPSPAPSAAAAARARLGWVAALLAAMVISPWMLSQRLPMVTAEPYWFEYLRLTFDEREQERERERAEYRGEEISEDIYAVSQNSLLKQKLTALAAAARHVPDDARIQLRMALGYLSLFHVLQKDADNPMTLAQIRDAALASEFPSTQDLNDWVTRAVGPNRKYLDLAHRHCLRALELCPLQGHGYLYLCELDFLRGATAEMQSKYLAQALRLRPYDAQVLFAAGREAWTHGKIKAGIEFWKGSFQRSVAYQQRIIDLLIDHVPAEFLIEKFEPDWQAYKRMKETFAVFKGTARDPEYRMVLTQYARKTIEEADATEDDTSLKAFRYALAQRAYDELGDRRTAQKCLEAALATDPNSFDMRYSIGLWLYQQGRYVEAAEHLIWCSRRKPQDEQIRTMAENANAEVMRQTASDPKDRSRG